jgi:acyl dehydratase
VGVSNRYILQQGAVLAALGHTVTSALRKGAAPGAQPPTLPGPEVRREQQPLPRDLIDTYVAHLGSDPRAYRGQVPPHLFPQWCFPALTRTLDGLPYPMLRVVNGGCRVEVREAIRDDEPIVVRAWLESIDDDGRRAVFHQRVLTGTPSAPEALSIDVYPIVPLGSGEGKLGETPPKKRERARVPDDARELLRYQLTRADALAFAKLTGDFNPIHWIPPYARMSGFRNVILHGFGSLARAWEGLCRSRFAGDPRAIASMDVKFTRPLTLPRDVGLYLKGDEITLGDAPSAPAYLTGRFTTRSTHPSGEQA